MASPSSRAVAELLAALAYGERLAHRRAQEAVALAPDPRGRQQQEHVARREQENASLVGARAEELGTPEMEEVFRPFLDAFFERTVPRDWVEAQAFHYVGDAIVRDFVEVLVPRLDRVSAEVVRRALADRDEQETYALDELTRAREADPEAGDRMAAYARRVIGEALTQTRRALDGDRAVRELFDGPEGEKELLLDLLERHRRRLDRLGIDPVEE